MFSQMFDLNRGVVGNPRKFPVESFYNALCVRRPSRNQPKRSPVRAVDSMHSTAASSWSIKRESGSIGNGGRAQLGTRGSRDFGA